MTRDFPPNQPITLWTRFKLPLSERLPFDDQTQAERLTVEDQWVSVLGPLVRSSGYCHSAWGRVEEDPEVVVMVSGKFTVFKFDRAQRY